MAKRQTASCVQASHWHNHRFHATALIHDTCCDPHTSDWSSLPTLSDSSEGSFGTSAAEAARRSLTAGPLCSRAAAACRRAAAGDTAMAVSILKNCKSRRLFRREYETLPQRTAMRTSVESHLGQSPSMKDADHRMRAFPAAWPRTRRPDAGATATAIVKASATAPAGAIDAANAWLHRVAAALSAGAAAANAAHARQITACNSKQDVRQNVCSSTSLSQM